MNEQVDTIPVRKSLLKKLKCTLCNNYLSCGPVYLQYDGTNVCGRCHPITSNQPAYENVTLESMLKELKFPCRYKDRGCDKKVLFNEAVQHENVCQNEESNADENRHLLDEKNSDIRNDNRDLSFDDDVYLLDDIKCNKCFEILKPPVFEYSGLKYCNSCRVFFSVEVKDSQFLNLLDKIKYPCRWNNCSFKGDAKNIKHHEDACEHRTNCICKHCGIWPSKSKAKRHFERHGYIYFDVGVPFTNNLRTNKEFCAIINDTFVTISYSQNNYYNNYCWNLSNCADYQLELIFIHNHCKLRSMKIILDNKSQMEMSKQNLFSKLPKCFSVSGDATIKFILTVHQRKPHKQ